MHLIYVLYLDLDVTVKWYTYNTAMQFAYYKM